MEVSKSSEVLEMEVSQSSLFTKDECEILDDGGDYICVGIRTVDNCYGITPSMNHKCYSIKIN